MRPGSVILTQEGMVFGTPEFMSPEQAQGKTLAPASDVYSLAVILYEVLTGKLPFEAKSAMDYIQMHVTGKPIPLNQRVAGMSFPPLLEQVMDRALAKREEDRFASAADFALAMQAVLQGATALPPAAFASSPQPPPNAAPPAPVGPAYGSGPAGGPGAVPGAPYGAAVLAAQPPPRGRSRGASAQGERSAARRGGGRIPPPRRRPRGHVDEARRPLSAPGARPAGAGYAAAHGHAPAPHPGRRGQHALRCGREEEGRGSGAPRRSHATADARRPGRAEARARAAVAADPGDHRRTACAR